MLWRDGTVPANLVLGLYKSLHWRHNDHDSVSNHQPHDCLLNRLFRRRSKKTSKLCVTGLCVGNSPGPVNSPHKGPVTRKMVPFDDVIMMPSSQNGVRLHNEISFTGMTTFLYRIRSLDASPIYSFVLHYVIWDICILNTLRPRQNCRYIPDDIFNQFSWMKMYGFRLRFHWSLFLRVQLTIS